MPVPVSLTRDQHIVAGRQTARSSADRSILDGNGDRAAVRHGIARIDDEVDQRQLELGLVGECVPDIARPPASRSRPGRRACESASPRPPRAAPAMSIGCGSSFCRRAKASRRRTSSLPCSAARLVMPRISRWSSSSSARFSSRPSPPITAASKLLKSCAMPPVSLPIASIFWAWISWLSSERCSDNIGQRASQLNRIAFRRP